MGAVEPRVSVVIPAYNARATIAACLRSLEAQVEAPPFEVLVVDSSRDGTAELARSERLDLRVLRCSERKFPGDARNLGAAHARGAILAFLDADCVADRHWLAAIVAAHTHPAPAICGVLENGNPENYVGWAYYFGEFSAWLPGSQPRYVRYLPGGLLSLKRWAFERYGPFAEGAYGSDVDFYYRLAAAGWQPYLVPTIRVGHLNPDNLAASLRHAIFHGRAFARVRSQPWSRTRRGTYLLAAPLLPVAVWAHLVSRVLQRRTYRLALVRAAPLVCLFVVAWCLGETRGYFDSLSRDRDAGPVRWATGSTSGTRGRHSTGGSPP